MRNKLFHCFTVIPRIMTCTALNMIERNYIQNLNIITKMRLNDQRYPANDRVQFRNETSKIIWINILDREARAITTNINCDGK